jgi:hypothetical protein
VHSTAPTCDAYIGVAAAFPAASPHRAVFLFIPWASCPAIALICRRDFLARQKCADIKPIDG